MIIKIIVLILIILIVFTIIDSNRFVVREINISSDKIKEDKDILFLSDLHGKSYGENNRRLLHAIFKLKFDFTVIAGDMLTAPPSLKSFETSVEFMRELASLGPIYYGLGNHEARAKSNTDYYGELYLMYETYLNAFGIKLYDNESLDIDENIRISMFSIPEFYYKKFSKLKLHPEVINKLVGPVCSDKYNILVAHKPDYFDAYASYGADLTLSGHNHGGVIRIPFSKGLISTSFTLFPKYDGGVFNKNGKNMIVNRGLGAHTIPFRLFNPAEILLIHLKGVEKK